MFHTISKDVREQVLARVREGKEKVADIASQHGISPKTIYGWLRNQVAPNISLIEVNRLRRENEELKRIIGIITLELERGKKNSHR